MAEPTTLLQLSEKPDTKRRRRSREKRDKGLIYLALWVEEDDLVVALDQSGLLPQSEADNRAKVIARGKIYVRTSIKQGSVPRDTK